MIVVDLSQTPDPFLNADWLHEEAIRKKGGEGSGHFGHGGRPGQRGGSAPAGAGAPDRGRLAAMFGRGATDERQINSLETMSRLPRSHTVHIREIEFLTYDELADKRGGRTATALANHHASEGGSEIELKVAPGENPDMFAGNLGSETQKSLLTHEIGHSVHSLMAPAEFGLEPRNARVNANAEEVFGSRDRAQLSSNVNELFSRTDRRSVSPVADSTAREYFAESYSHYVHFPQLLRSRDSAMYDWMRDNVFDGEEYGD